MIDKHFLDSIKSIDDDFEILMDLQIRELENILKGMSFEDYIYANLEYSRLDFRIEFYKELKQNLRKELANIGK